MLPAADRPIRVRHAQPGDAAPIGELVRELQREMGMPMAFPQAQLQRMLSAPDSGTLLAVVDDVVAGLLSYNVCQGLLHGGASFRIEELIVGSAFRRRGIGRALLAEAERQALRLGCVELEVTTLDDNLPAQDLYRSAGFVGGAILMEKDLAPGFDRE
jgi:GNAT superfamily N-acetyltransferase